MADGETPKLSVSEERRLLRHVLWQPERQWDVAAERAMERLLGRGRVRRLDEARFQLHLAADDWDLRSLSDDDYTYEHTKDTVLSSYVRLQREVLEEAFQIDQRFDAWLDHVTRRDRRDEYQVSRDGRSYRLRLSPQINVGSHNYLGVKLRVPYAESAFFDHFSLYLRHDFTDDHPAYIIKYDSDDVFLDLRFRPDTPRGGDEFSLTLKMWF